MNKKPLDTLLQQPDFNETLFKHSQTLVKCTQILTPPQQVDPIELSKTKAQLKKKQQLLQTSLSKTIKLFGQVIGVQKNSFGTMTDFAVEIFDQLTDLIQTSCQSFNQKKKNIKAIQKQKELSKQSLTTPSKQSTRPQSIYPSVKPANFSKHIHQFPPVQNLRLIPPAQPQQSFPISEPFTYINSLPGLQKMIQELSQCREIAVDLQHSMKSYEGMTCLIQISSRSKDYILDVFPIWDHISLLKKLIENPQILKVMHGAEMDTKWLQRDFNIHIVNLFDTYKASRVLGYPKFSYAYLLHHYCNIAIDKTYQLADWRQRPLSPDMLTYARMDTHFLLEIFDHLLIDLTKQSNSMHLCPEQTILDIYKSSHEVTLSEVELFTYKKKELYQNLKNDTKPDDFEIIETVFWTIDKVARDEDECFDDLVNKRTLTDVFGRIKDLIQNRRATIDMLRVKIDRLLGAVKSNSKHEKVPILLQSLKRELEKYFLEPKKSQEKVNNKKSVANANSSEQPLIQRLNHVKSSAFPSKENKSPEQKFIFEKHASMAIEQLDYPLKTYENFSLQQRLLNKKSSFSLIEFEPIMSFLSKKFSITQKTQEEQRESQSNEIDEEGSESMEIEAKEPEGEQTQKQNEGFLEFKRIKPNVIYTIEEEKEENREVEKKPRKKRKELEYEEKLKNKEGNIYELLEDV